MTLLQLDKFFDMELIQAGPLKCVTLLDIFKKGWEEGMETKELVLSLGTNQAGTRRYKWYMSYASHHGDIYGINSEEKQRSDMTTITCDKNSKWYCDHYLILNILKILQKIKVG